MKYFQILIAIILIIAFSSCKKNYIFTKADLIGTWTQTQPYPGNFGPYILRFDSNNIVYETSPYLDSGNYTLSNNNVLAMDCGIEEGPTCSGLGPITYNISGDATDLTFEDFFSSPSTSGATISYNIHLKK